MIGSPWSRMRRLRRPAVALLALAIAGPSAAAAEKRAFGLEDVYRVRVPADVDLSPDGRSVVYSLDSKNLPRGTSNADLYRVPAAGGEATRLTWTEDASESSPVHSPDGRSLAFVARRAGQEHAQLWLLPTAGGDARPLTDLPTDVSDPVWSPDGRRLAFTAEVYPDCGTDWTCHRKRDARRRDGPLHAHMADELLYRHWDSWSDGRVVHVLLVEVESGTVRDLTPGDREAPSNGGSGGYAFSPDGKEICFTRNSDSAKTLAWSTNSDLWVVAVDPGADGVTAPARNVTANNLAWDGMPRYSPDGRYIAFRRQSRPGYESDLFQLALADRSTGEVRVLAPEFDNWVTEFRWLPDGKGLVFAAPFEGRTPLYRLGLGGAQPRKVADFAFIDEFVLSKDGTGAFAVRRSVGDPAEIWRFDLSGAEEPLRLTRHNLALEDEVDIRPAESVWVESSDGARIQVFLVKPHGFDPSRKYPLILNVHGGPQYMWADAFRGDWQVYPGAGYVVAFPNPRGSTGYGQAFTDAISRDWGGRVFDDLMRVTDYLAKLPYVDDRRLGAMGWSWGGYMMNWFQGHTRRFAALACMMGLIDLRSFYLSTEELWFPEWDLGGAPWDSEAYELWNPAASIRAFSTPMLIVTGERDYRIPYTQGLMSFTALRRRGIPARLIVFSEAGHWPGWYEMALYYTAHLDWFHRYLGGKPPPWSVEDFMDNAVFDAETGERIGERN